MLTARGAVYERERKKHTTATRKAVFTKKSVTSSGPKRVQRQNMGRCGSVHKNRPSRKAWH